MIISANFLTINSLKVSNIDPAASGLTTTLPFDLDGIYTEKLEEQKSYIFSIENAPVISTTTLIETETPITVLDTAYYDSIYKEIMNKCNIKNISKTSYSNFLKNYTTNLAGIPYTTDKVSMTDLYNEAIKWLNPYGSSINITPSGTTTSIIGNITNIIGNTTGTSTTSTTTETTNNNTGNNTNPTTSEISGNTTSSITYSYNVRIGSSSRMPYTLSQTIGVYDSDFVSTEGNTMDYVAITISRRLTTGGWDMDWGSVTVVKANFPTGYGSSINKDFNSSDNFDKVVGYPATIMYMKGARLGVTSTTSKYTYKITYNDEQSFTPWTPGSILEIPVNKYIHPKTGYTNLFVLIFIHEYFESSKKEFSFYTENKDTVQKLDLTNDNNNIKIKEISVKAGFTTTSTEQGNSNTTGSTVRIDDTGVHTTDINGITTTNPTHYKVSYNYEETITHWDGKSVLEIPYQKYIIEYGGSMTVEIFIKEYYSRDETGFLSFYAANKSGIQKSVITSAIENTTKLTEVSHQMTGSPASNTTPTTKYDYRINQSEWVTNKTSADLWNIPVKSSDFSSGSATITVRKAGGDYIGEVYYDLNDFPKGNDFATKQNNIGVGIGLKCSDCVSSTPNEGFGEDTSSTTSNTTNSITAGGYTATFDPELAHTVSKTGTNVTVALVNSTILNPYVKVYLNGNLVYSGNLGYETHTEHLSNGDTLYTNPSNGQ